MLKVMAAEYVLENFINGVFVPSKSYIDSFNPSNGELLCKVPDSDDEDVERAITAAKSSYKGWSSISIAERSKVLLRVADLIEAKLNQLAEAESKDQGKPLWVSKSVDIPRAVLNFRHFALSAQCDSDKAIHQLTEGIMNYTVHRPVGIAAIIVPWNLPLYLLTFKLAPALVYGNTVIIKPSEFTSVTAWMLCQILQEAGVPSGVVNVVFGYGPKVGEVLIKHPQVDLVSFTGSTVTGCHIAEVCGQMSKKLSLEMGGKNAAIVFSDADLPDCVTTLIKACFINSGQVCLSMSRIYIHQSIFSTFVGMFVKAAEKLKVGDAFSQDVFLGPLCSKQHFEKVLSYLQLAKEEGAVFLMGEENIDPSKAKQTGYFASPSVLTQLPESSRCMQEEIFGPVTCLMSFINEDEVIQRVNGTSYGLCATIWSKDISRIHGIAPKLEVGTVWCNCWLHRNLHMPFGGMKMSGNAREGTEDSREFYTTKKTICVKFK